MFREPSMGRYMAQEAAGSIIPALSRRRSDVTSDITAGTLLVGFPISIR